jgi:hypothetical protein
MYIILTIPKVNDAWPGLTWQQCLLGSKLPCYMIKVAAIWSLLCGYVIWYCWLDKNTICFSNDNWELTKMEHFLLDAFPDHAWTTWYRTKRMVEKNPRKTSIFIFFFDKVWMQLLGEVTMHKS